MRVRRLPASGRGDAGRQGSIRPPRQTTLRNDLDLRRVGTLCLAAGARYGAHYAEVHASGLTIGLHPRRPGDDTGLGDGNLSIGFLVDGIDAVVTDLTRAGLAFTSQENDANRFAFFRDPDGTPLYLFEPKVTPE